MGLSEIDEQSIDLFASCVAKQRAYGLPDGDFIISQAVSKKQFYLFKKRKMTNPEA